MPVIGVISGGFAAGGKFAFSACMGLASGEIGGRFDVECVEQAREAWAGLGRGEVTALAAGHHLLRV